MPHMHADHNPGLAIGAGNRDLAQGQIIDEVPFAVGLPEPPAKPHGVLGGPQPLFEEQWVLCRLREHEYSHQSLAAHLHKGVHGLRVAEQPRICVQGRTQWRECLLRGASMQALSACCRHQDTNATFKGPGRSAQRS